MKYIILTPDEGYVKNTLSLIAFMGGYLAIKILNSVFMLVKQQQALKGLKNEKYKELRK